MPFSDGLTAESVEGIWQGLKVFESAGVDPSKFRITSMKGIKRTVRKFGGVLGHQAGERLVPYLEARRLIYLPAYRLVLENKLADLVQELKASAAQTLVLLDYETNTDVSNLSKPLSHAGLVKAVPLESQTAHCSDRGGIDRNDVVLVISATMRHVFAFKSAGNNLRRPPPPRESLWVRRGATSVVVVGLRRSV